MKFVSKGAKEEKHRLILLTDMENEPDDAQTMVRLLMYANEIDIEGLIAVTSCHLPNMVFPESIEVRVQAYGFVRDNLLRHTPGWPTAQMLMARVAGGQRGYGMSAVGKGQGTPGSALIIQALDRPDARPVWFAINAGANTLAQALWEVRNTRSEEEVRRFVSKIRVYDDSGQDDAGAWMCHEFPGLVYLRSRYQVFGLYGPEEGCGPDVTAPLDHYEWAELNVRTRHGILGALYPQRMFKDGRTGFLEGGGTSTWIGLANKGLFVPDQITWGGWGGRFEGERTMVPAGQFLASESEKQHGSFLMYAQTFDESYAVGETTVASRFSGCGLDAYETRYFAPLWRWREAYTNDFKARMDWCVMDYLHANHHPVAVLFGDANRTVARLSVRPGESITLDATGSFDPDNKVRLFRDAGHLPAEAITFGWYNYPEAGTYGRDVRIKGDGESIARLTVPEDAAGRQIHIILDVQDMDQEAPLHAYRRIVIDVEEKG